jgi:hypothetical protein
MLLNSGNSTLNQPKDCFSKVESHFICLFSSHLKTIYGGKQFVLFCNYEIHQTKMLQIVFLVSSEKSQQGGVHGFGSMTFGLVVQKFLNIE